MRWDSLVIKWTVAIAVIVIAILLLIVLPRPSGGLGMPVYASQGQMVSGFPRTLLLDSTPQITQSYSISYPSSTNQYTVEWNSSAQPQSLIAGYLVYFSQYGWQIINQENTSTVDSIFASNSSGTVNLAVSPRGTGSAAVLSYVVGASAPLPAQSNLIVHQSVLVQDFPLQFIVDGSAVILSSSDNPDFSSGMSGTAAIYRSGETVDALFKKYAVLFGAKNWQTVSQSSSSALSAISGLNTALGEFVSVSIQPIDNASVVTVSVESQTAAITQTP